jgi:hypothetical protein
MRYAKHLQFKSINDQLGETRKNDQLAKRANPLLSDTDMTWVMNVIRRLWQPVCATGRLIGSPQIVPFLCELAAAN